MLVTIVVFVIMFVLLKTSKPNETNNLVYVEDVRWSNRNYGMLLLYNNGFSEWVTEVDCVPESYRVIWYKMETYHIERNAK